MARSTSTTALVPYDPFIAMIARGHGLYYTALAIMGLLSLLFLAIGVVGWYGAGNPLWFLTSIVLVIAWIAVSLRQVGVDEIGGAAFFGAPVREYERGKGLCFVPWLLLSFETLPGRVLESEFPGEPENVYKGTDDAFPHGDGELVRPVRITAGTGKSEGGHNGPLEVQMTAEIQWYIRWRIFSYFQFKANIGSIETARKQLRDTTERILVELAGKRTMGGVVRETSEMNEEILAHAQRIMSTGSWGAEVLEAGIKEPDLSHDVNISLAGVASARADADRIVALADAEKARLIKEGEGKASAAKEDLVARGQGIASFAESADVCGGEVLQAEVAANMFGESDKVVLGGADGLKDLFAAAQVVVEGTRKSERDSDKKKTEDK